MASDNVTANQKRSVVSQLVVDTLTPRIEALRDNIEAHWRAVAAEVFTTDYINQANYFIRGLAEGPVAKIVALQTNASLHSPLFEDLTKLDVKGMTHLNLGNDPASVVTAFGYRWQGLSDSESESLRTAIRTAYGQEDIIIDLPVPVLVISKLPSDGECEAEETEYLTGANRLLPTNCKTQKAFTRCADGIKADAGALYVNIMNKVRTQRRAATITNAVPELKPYLYVEASADLSAMIQKAGNLL